MSTCDKGKAFAAHEEVAEALNAAVYYAHPNTSRKKGTNSRHFRMITSALLRIVLISGRENELTLTLLWNC